MNGVGRTGTALARVEPEYEGMAADQPPVPGMDGIFQERIDGAVDSLAELIVSCLRSRNPNRFAEAYRLCHIGQQLVRTQASTMDALVKLEEPRELRPMVQNHTGYGQVYGNYGVGNYGAIVGTNGAVAFGGQPVMQPEDAGHNPETRRAALIADPARQVERERAAAEVAMLETNELAALLTLLASAELPAERRPVIAQRITTLTQSIETRNHAHVQQSIAV